LPGFNFTDQPVASNGWALGSGYSASGNAMLLANPHLDWRGMETFYESHFLLPDVNLYGTALVGSPVLQIAFNDHLGWTHTVNTMDGCDLYQLKLVGSALDEGYWLDGATQFFNTTTEIIQIRRQDGSLANESLRIHRAKQGPVIEAGDQMLAVRFALLETSLLAGMNRQWWEMARASNLNEFQHALQGQHLPLFNVVYADLPKSIDPPGGWVQNSNGAPWYMTMPFLDKNRYPSNIAADVTNNRELRGLQMLHEHQQMSYAELIAAKHSTRALVADQLLDELAVAARGSDDPLLQQAADVLDRWDRQYLAESQGGWLFGIWFEKWLERTIAKATDADPNYDFTFGQLIGDLFYAQPFDSSQPLNTPRGLADVPLAILALHDAASELQATVGVLDIAWGDIARLRRGKIDLPGNGASTVLGVFREIIYEQDEDGKFKSASGDTYIALVEFSQPVRAQVLTIYGNATQNNALKSVINCT